MRISREGKMESKCTEITALQLFCCWFFWPNHQSLASSHSFSTIVISPGSARTLWCVFCCSQTVSERRGCKMGWQMLAEWHPPVDDNDVDYCHLVKLEPTSAHLHRHLLLNLTLQCNAMLNMIFLVMIVSNSSQLLSSATILCSTWPCNPQHNSHSLSDHDYWL